jgi:hypothetical protein
VPRGAEAEAADVDGLVELLPALVPVVGDLGGRDLDERVAGGGAEVGQDGQLARGAVDGVLDAVAVVHLLDAARGELEQLGQHDLGVLAADADGEAEHG